MSVSLFPANDQFLRSHLVHARNIFCDETPGEDARRCFSLKIAGPTLRLNHVNLQTLLRILTRVEMFLDDRASQKTYSIVLESGLVLLNP